jgi:rRNA maturation protein Nop10
VTAVVRVACPHCGAKIALRKIIGNHRVKEPTITMANGKRWTLRRLCPMSGAEASVQT